MMKLAWPGKWINVSRAKPPSATDAGRVLAELACLSTRERIRARARLMREEMGLPPAPELNSRTKETNHGRSHR